MIHDSLNETNDVQGLPVIESASGVGSCCGWARSLFVAGCAVVTLTAIGVAAYFAGQASQISQYARPGFPLPAAHASASVTSEKFSLATGAVSEEGEGVFVLDHNSGLLQCSIIYPRMGQMMAQFTVNVAEALGTGGKGGAYIMATGLVDFPRNNARPVASCVVYVLDTASGNYACFGLPFDRTAVSAGRPQRGAMVLLYTGTANPVIDRDSLR